MGKAHRPLFTWIQSFDPCLCSPRISFYFPSSDSLDKSALLVGESRCLHCLSVLKVAHLLEVQIDLTFASIISVSTLDQALQNAVAFLDIFALTISLSDLPDVGCQWHLS